METQELFEILPEGFFTTPEELQAFINQEGVDDLYQLVPKDLFPTLEDFQGSLKKKVDTESISVDGSWEQLGLPEPSQEEDGFFERNFGYSEFTDFLDDTTVNIRMGLAQGASINDALRLQRKGSRATPKDIEKYESAIRKMESIPVSDEMISFNKIYNAGGKTWLSFIKGIKKNPTAITGIIAQAVSSMLNPSVAFGAIKGGVAGGVAGGVGGFAVGGAPLAAVGFTKGVKYGGIAGLTNTLEGGLAFTEFLQEEIEKRPDLEFNDEGIAAILNDEEAFRRVKSRTRKRGYSIALVNAMTYGVANTLVRSGRNIKRLGNLKIGKRTLPTSRLLPSPQTAIRMGTEFVGGGLGEVAGRAMAGQEMDVAEIGFEAFGELGSPEAIIPTFKNSKYTIDGERVTKNDVLDIMNGPRAELLGTKIDIENDASLDQEVQTMMKRAMVEKRVKQGLTPSQNEAITDEQLNQLIDLTLQYEDQKESNTPEGIRNAAKTDEQIKQITNAIQEPSTEKVDAQKPAPDGETVGKGDIQQQPITGKIAPKETKTTQHGEEVTTETETEEKIKSDLEKARAGDVKMQRKFEKHGIDWKYNPTYRFVGQAEVDALNNKETIKGKFEDGRVDVTISEEPSTGEDAQYRITYKEDVIDSGDPNNKMRMKNDVDGWIMGGYTLDDVSVIEKINPDGTLEVVYEADTTEVTTETQTEESQGLEPISAGIARQLIKSGEENKPPDPLDKYKTDEDGNVVIDEVEEDNWYWMKRDSELGWLDIVIKNKEEVVSISIDGKEVDFVLKNKIENELIDEGVITPSEKTQTTKPGEEVTTETQTEESQVEDKGIYALQSETAEGTVSDLNLWGQSGVWRKKIEDAGDILREINLGSTKRYIQEKVDSLQDFIERKKQRGEVKPTDNDFVDSYQYLIENHSNAVDKIRSEYEALPVESDLNILARDLIFDVLNNNLLEAEIKLNKIQSILDSSPGHIIDRKYVAAVEEVTTETETEVETVEVTYTLPEDPKEAKKDFEIIDNRNQKAGLDIDEEGNGKYYVINIKTGSIVAVKTKSEAQVTIANPESFDYGEGKPVLQEFRTKVEEKVVEEVAPGTHKIGNFDVVIKDNKIVSITKDGKEAASASRNKVVKKLVDQGLINVDAGQDSPNVGEISNPRRLALTVQALEKERFNTFQTISQMKESGIESLFGTKFTPKSISDHFGLSSSEMGKGFMQSWVRTKEKGGESIEDGFIDNNEQEFSKDEVGDFIQTYPSERAFDDAMKTDLTNQLKEAKERFTEITGLKPTPTILQAVIDGPTQQEFQERADIQESKRVDEEQRQAEAQGFVEKKAPEKKAPEKKAPKEKPTPPKKTIKKPAEAPVNKEVEKTVDEIGTKVIDKITPKILRLQFGNMYAKTKNWLGRAKGVVNVLQEQMRSIPIPKIDQIFGNENSTLIYRKIFLPLVRSYQQYSDRFKQKEKIILDAENKLIKEAKGNINKAKINGYKIAIAQKALIHESNPDSEVTPPVLDLLDFTIKLAADGEIPSLNPLAIKELKKLRAQYTKDGKITFKDVYKSLTPTQKQVFITLQEQNKSLEAFADRAATRRGIKLEKLNDYSHRIVLGDREKEIDAVKEQAEDWSDPSTMARNILERTKGVKAVSFDPFLSSLRATQEVYLDYYMSPVISIVQQITAQLNKKFSKGNKGQRAAVIGLEKTLRELLRVTYLRSFVPTTIRGQFLTEMKRMGYRLLLGSAPRFVAELAGNSAMLLAEDPIVVKNAITKYKKFSMTPGVRANTKFINALTELGSGETDKLGGRLVADSKYSDKSGILNINSRNRHLYNPILNKMEQISKLPKKYTYDTIAGIQDFLMAGGDRLISRPIWVSKFANEFKKNVKKYYHEDVDLSVEDFNEISDGESKYLNEKYRKAREEAVTEADRIAINISTSSNPFNAIVKNVKRNDVKDYYRTINTFMANFTLNEYATARFAIGAMFRSGELSKKQATLLLTGVLARMSSYVLVYGLLADLLDEEIFGAPEDDDDELDSLVYRQLIGSVMTLMFRQNLGNITSLPINLGIEELNKKYLEELRDGKPYNSYENSIVYSLITLDRLDKGLANQVLPILTGPYVEYYKTANRAIELYNRTKTRKTQVAKDRAIDELREIILLQVQGQLGLLPFYKDIIRQKRKKFYAENYGSSSGSSSGGIKTY